MLIFFRTLNKEMLELELPEQGGIVGHDPENFITIEEVGVSSRHFRLTAEGSDLFIEDLQSLNGVFIGQTQISEKTKISDGDCIQVGLLLLNFYEGMDFWSITSASPDKSKFVVYEQNGQNEDGEPDEFSTAITIIPALPPPPSRPYGILKPQDIGLPAVFVEKTDVPIKKVSFDELEELGKFEIIRKIGKGGMGVVYLAKHTILNSYRALKVFSFSTKKSNNDFFERFVREAHIASVIRHPNIVEVMDAETDQELDLSYIVMEFIDGGTLRRILKSKKKMAEIQVLLIAKKVALALKCIEEHNIIHRDIKPDNIMFTRSGEVKLADLGIAKNNEEDVSITQNDAMIGTPAYLSPEQIENPKEVDIRSDIYSLGATLYEMLTGTPPYKGKNTYEIVHKMLTEPICDPRLKNPAVSSITAKIIMKMLNKNPAFRYQTPKDLLDVLNKVLPEYPEKEILKITQAAILGTELPNGVKPRLAVGFKAFMSFLFFSFRVSTAAFFHKLFGRNDDSNEAEYLEPVFSFKADPEKVPFSIMSVIIKTSPRTDFVFTSSHRETVEVTSDSEGYLRIDGLPKDEYTIRLKDEKK